MTVTSELNDRIGKCRKIMATNPNSQIFAALAEAMRKNGDLEEAFRVCQTGLRAHPKYGAAHSIMAKINLDRGQFDWAEEELNRARELGGPSRATDILMAEILIYKGDFEKAISTLKTLLRDNPQNEHIQKLIDIANSIARERDSAKHEAAQGLANSQASSGVVDHALVDPDKPAESPNGSTVTSVTAAEIVQSAGEIKELSGALFVNNEGLLVESEWSDSLDPELCALSLSEVTSLLNQDLTRNSFGQVTSVLIETADQTFQLVRRSNGTFVFVSSSRMNLGPVRMKLSELFDRYQD